MSNAPTEPKAPDIVSYLLVCAVCVGAVLLLYISRRDTFQGGFWGFAFVEACIGAAYFLLLAAALRKYDNAKIAYELWKRAQPAVPAMPDPHNIYNIHGTVSLRTKDGGWIDIGEGTGTFTIKPPRAATPPLPDFTGIHRRAHLAGTVDVVQRPADLPPLVCAECGESLAAYKKGPEWGEYFGGVKLHRWCVEGYAQWHQQKKQTPPTG